MPVKRRSHLQKAQALSLLFLIIIAVTLLSARNCMSAEPLNVYVVNYPLKYFAERIGGEQINLVLPAPTGIDPAYWIPDIPTIAAYQQADLILINGTGYAKWVDKVSLPRSKVVDTSKKFKDRYITIEGATTHSHGPEGEHAHEGIAFTTWLDFSLVAEQAKAITTALSRKRPDLKDTFQKNYQKLEQDLLKLDQDLKTLIPKDPSRPLVVSHPVYDYFARRYGLNIKNVHWEPDEIPTNEQMLELNSILKEHPAQWMIWEGEPMKKSALTAWFLTPASIYRLRKIF
jgi:zinc transport system substrate-binding protein